MTFHRSQDFRRPSAATLSQTHPLLLMIMIMFYKKTAGLQHIMVVGEASAAIEEVGEADTAGKEVDEGTVEGALTEIVVAGVVSSSLECSLIWRLTRGLYPAYRGRGDGDFRGRGEGKEQKPIRIIFMLTCGLRSSGYRGRGDGEWRGGRGDGEWRGGRGDGEWRGGRGDGEWRGRGEGKETTVTRSRLMDEGLIRLPQASEDEETGMKVTVAVGGDEVMLLLWKREVG